MADLYPPSYTMRHRDDSQYSQYPPPLLSAGSSNNSSDDNHDQPPSPTKSADHQKPEAKPQATFLTKLYALLERPENHHMIRWDPAGEHIIVERPEQLALHVLPSIYRQSRFASFSRQLNIYGFMRKVNLRNVDPAIDDPDASTWSHPTLNRHSPPEVVANFKRRVPPRLPKPRKRDIQDQQSIPPPRSAIGMGPVPLTVPSSVGHPSHKLLNGPIGRARGFSAPGSFTPLNQGAAGGAAGAATAAGWNNNFSRSALPPLMVPSDPPHIPQQNNMYNHSPQHLHPITPSDDTPSPNFHQISNYSSSNQSQYHHPYQNEHSSWSYHGGSSSHNSSLSSLLNPSSNGYSRPQPPTINTSYGSPFSSMPMQGEHSASSLSPDSRPTTGYSMSSVSSMPYQDDYSRPSSSHHRPISPARPTSSKSNYNNSGSLSVRRERRHSQAVSPYPSPYDHPNEQQRPSTSPQPIDNHQSAGLPRVRSMIQLPSVDPYSFNSSQAEFAYSAIPGAVGHTASMESMNDANGWASHRTAVRPSTSTSSISAASHTSSSQANTPPVPDNYHGETDINRFSPDFGFVPMNEHLPHHHYNKVASDL
ncbi:Heat shock factor protein 4 [Psilocybe cubensis]|uniref:Heat shock factor protein 4 n=2 Tax=Psilocybe cubensis TaxID=181762 RepID=A0ACB8H5C7_PSICU|nr:Heat shock factor protein 4 [Psilocybe cubensis]KAH9482852.1 Heat shock factor protein 4 [Psilocybe cubensis]